MIRGFEDFGWRMSDLDTTPITLEKAESETRMTARVVVDMVCEDSKSINPYSINWQLNTPNGIYEDKTVYCASKFETKLELRRIVFAHIEAYLSRATNVKEIKELYRKYKIR